METIGLYNYWVVVVLMMTGFYIVVARDNLIKKVIGLSIFQTSVFLLFISVGKVEGGTAPIIIEEAHGVESATDAADAAVIYSNPLPSVLILTAIVVGVATTAVALGLVVRINEEYGTIEETEIHRQDAEA